MYIIKLLINDFIVFLLNMIILSITYTNFIYQNFATNLALEMLCIALSYYIISFLNAISIVYLLYLRVNFVFDKYQKLTIFKKLEIVSYIFDRDYEELYSTDDFELKLKNYLALTQ